MAAGAAVNEERLMSRLRWRLIPYILLLYIIAMIDRVNIGVAALTMNKDLGLSAEVFGSLAGIFFVFYFIFEVPSNAILHRVGARIWIARILVTWGIVAVLEGFARGATDMAILRSLLGAAEAGFYPGIVLYFTYLHECDTVGRGALPHHPRDRRPGGRAQGPAPRFPPSPRSRCHRTSTPRRSCRPTRR